MGKGLQNVVNQWVNVNNNHVVFPEDGEGNVQANSERNLPNLNTPNAFNSLQHQPLTSNGQSGHQTMNGNTRRDLSTRNGTLLKSGDRSFKDPYSFPRQTQQRMRGKLKKTNSQSDLLKERAAIRGKMSDDGSRGPVGAQKDLSGSGPMPRDKLSSATSISSDRSSQKLPVNTGQYVNEIAFANQHRSMQLAAQQSDQMKVKQKRKPLNQSLDQGAEGPRRSSLPENMRFNSLPSVSSSNEVSTASKKTSTSAKDSSNCDHCEKSNSRILRLEADLEYIRSSALNSEYVCQSCEKMATNLPMNSASSVTSGRSVKSNRSRQSKSSGRMIDSSVHSIGTRSRKSNRPTEISFFNENIALSESSQRLIDANSRHKRQLEHLSREMARWKNEMHLKLSKLAMMCQDLNGESAKRKEQVNVVNQDLSVVREERDTLSSELDILKARVILYEKQEAENIEIRRMLRENENETLAMADQAISERDAIIEDLTTRLQQSITLLDSERHPSQVKRVSN